MKTELPKPIQIALDMIIPHRNADPAIDEFLICADFLLSQPKEHLSEKLVDQLLELHPIMVVSAKGGTYHCVGGRRSLSITRNILPSAKKITVILMPKMTDSEIESRRFADIFIAATCFSVTEYSWLHRLILSMPAELKLRDLFVKNHGPSKLSRLLNISRETERQWARKTKKPN